MLKVGLTGGYASGKSFVAAEMERLGCHLINADKLGHQVLSPEGEAYSSVAELFGPEIIAPDGTIDRKQLGAIVFQSPDLLEKLTARVHPAVFRLEEKMLTLFAEQDPSGIVVVEAAILIETGRHRLFDRLILTSCSEDLQISRGMARDGLTREQILERLRQQMPLESKKAFADYVVETGTSMSITTKDIERIVGELRRFGERVL